MTSQTLQKRRKVSIGAQDMIRVLSKEYKHGLLREKRRKLNIGKWPFRFVVLTCESLYIFANETSKSPTTLCPLRGYNGVKRAISKGHEWCFSLVPAENSGHLKVRTFACVTDEERLDWMREIRSQLYYANGIAKPEPDVIDKLKSLFIGDGDDREEYVAVEQLVYQPDADNSSGVVGCHNDESDDSFSYSSDEEPKFVKKRSQSLPFGSLVYNDATSDGNTLPTARSSSKNHSEPGSSAYESVNDTISALPGAFSSNKKRSCLLRTPSDPTPSPPPRYSSVITNNECDEPAYVNMKAVNDQMNDNDSQIYENSLESLCTVHDSYADRDYLICLLQAKKEPGTYLMRNSRTSESKIIAYLTQNGHVKEFKIFQCGDRLSLDCQKNFESIEELLKNYTYVDPLPKTPECFLRKGFHQIP